MENYKEEIVETRRGSLGSSDAAVVASVGTTGALTGAVARRRVAQMLGLAERPDFKSEDMEEGDAIEMTIYYIVKTKFEPQGYEVRSNPMYKSTASKDWGFGVISHIDFELENATEIIWFENKASKFDTPEVMKKYTAQLQWHLMLLKEKARALGKGYRLFLSHYRTKVTNEFDANNLKIVNVQEDVDVQNRIIDGLVIIAEALADFKWEGDTEISIFETTKPIASGAEEIREKLEQMKELESRIAEFKKDLMAYIVEHGGVSIKAEGLYTISYTAAHKSPKFDMERFKKDHPELVKEYTKQSDVKASISIKLK